MTNHKEIIMIKCPACNENWIQEAEDLVCSACIPGVQADMVIYQVHNSIQDIDKLPINDIKTRLSILRRAKDHLEAIIQAAERAL